MTDRVELRRGEVTISVVPGDVEWFTAAGFAEAMKPAVKPEATARKRRTAKAGGE